VNDVLDPGVIAKIGEQMRDAARAAQENYESYMADEDTVTGALGGTFDHIVRGTFVVNGTRWSWRTRTKKLRGRGPGADEKEIGADGLFEIEVQDANGVILARKSLPFQAKNDRRGSRARLAEQARKIAALPGGGCVVDYSRDGYTAVNAQTVADQDGAWPMSPATPLGDYLAQDFLPCRVGSRDLYYDAGRHLLIYTPPGGGMQALPLLVGERIRTTVALAGGRTSK
jgi:hypothetical protein